MPAGVEPPSEADRLEELRTSARGWHGVQLAVLGFIGLCGVLTEGEASAPTTLQALSGLLALAALATACLGTYLVARAAWPLYGPSGPRPSAPDPDDLRATSRRLRHGIALTFVAVALLAVSASAGWWPDDDDGATGPTAAAVEVEARGSAWCGRLDDTEAGALLVETAAGRVAIPLTAVTGIRAVDRCA
jgi:hypothetical protein